MLAWMNQGRDSDDEAGKDWCAPEASGELSALRGELSDGEAGGGQYMVAAYRSSRSGDV